MREFLTAFQSEFSEKTNMGLSETPQQRGKGPQKGRRNDGEEEQNQERNDSRERLQTGHVHTAAHLPGRSNGSGMRPEGKREISVWKQAGFQGKQL